MISTFRDRLPEIFPGRTVVPKTLIYAKDDAHAEDIVKVVREEFGKGNDFCEKITYKTTSAKLEDLLAAFRNSPNPRIAVTVDMIATGTDVKPLEVVFFMRNVRSRNYFEQMKGRGVRVITPNDFQAVTPDAKSKDRFVIVDAVGVTESELSDSYTLNKQPSVSLDTLLDLVGKGSRDPEVLSTLASRLSRLDRQLTPDDRRGLVELASGRPFGEIIASLIHAVDPDAPVDTARQDRGEEEPSEEAIVQARHRLLEEAARPIASSPALRQRLADVRRSYEQTIDTISTDKLLAAGYSTEAAERAKAMTVSFEQYIQEHKDELTALQALYSRPYKQRLTDKDIQALADALKAPPRAWTKEMLWDAYQRLDKTKVRGSGQRILTDIVSLVRFALGQEDQLAPFPEHVDQRFEGWMAMQEIAGRRFTLEQRSWLEAIRDAIAGSISVGLEDMEKAPFIQWGGLGRAAALFGEELEQLLDELSRELVA